jgi:hypothetical protein
MMEAILRPPQALEQRRTEHANREKPPSPLITRHGDDHSSGSQVGNVPHVDRGSGCYRDLNDLAARRVARHSGAANPHPVKARKKCVGNR